MDLFKPELYAMSAYDHQGYLALAEDLSGHIFGSTGTAQAPSYVEVPWLASDSGSTSEEPSSPFSARGMSPMSPRDDEDSFSESSSSLSEAQHQALQLQAHQLHQATASVESMAVDYALAPEGEHRTLINPKKRNREATDQFLEAQPAAKLAKLSEDQPFSSTLPSLPAIDGAPGLHTLLAQHYSWNQMQIHQVVAYLNATQIQQALNLAGQSSEVDLASLAPMYSSALALPLPSAHAPSVDFGREPYVTEAADLAAVPSPAEFAMASLKSSPKKKTSAAPTAATASKKRPKLDPKKDALQCLGHNRKKNKQCGNAALMEFIGPRPLYCAEHIDQDPTSLYTKCCSLHHRTSGEGKGCREVVLKELNCCHKHYDQITAQWPLSPAGLAMGRSALVRVSEILELLEAEAAAAKKTDPDLFQRKHKIIPKFVQLIRSIEQWILDARAAGVTAVAGPTPMAEAD